MDTSDEWIRQRTGIHQRHFAPEGVAAADLAYEASKVALEDAGVEASDIDYILLATMTPDYMFPGSGALLGEKLGIGGVPALDIRQQCAATLFGLQVANGLMASEQAETILFVGAEAHAGFMPWKSWDVLYADEDRRVPDDEYELATKHRGIAIIFGDGAGAWVLKKTEDEKRGLLGVKITTCGRQAEQLYIPAGFRQRPLYLGSGRRRRIVDSANERARSVQDSGHQTSGSRSGGMRRGGAIPRGDRPLRRPPGQRSDQPRGAPGSPSARREGPFEHRAVRKHVGWNHSDPSRRTSPRGSPAKWIGGVLSRSRSRPPLGCRVDAFLIR